MAADGRHRCRWCNDGPDGRCPHPQAFPGMADVPPFCTHHLAALEPWIAARAARRAAGARQWIEWARRRAQDTEETLRALGLAAPRQNATSPQPRRSVSAPRDPAGTPVGPGPQNHAQGLSADGRTS